MYRPLRHQFLISLTSILLLLCIGWHSESMALDTADVPLTRATPSKHASGKEGDVFPKAAYGYQWWRFQDDHPTVSNLAVNDVYTAWGYGGQVIFIIPHLDMVVVSTGNNSGANESVFLDVLREHIFPAVLN